MTTSIEVFTRRSDIQPFLCIIAVRLCVDFEVAENEHGTLKIHTVNYSPTSGFLHLFQTNFLDIIKRNISTTLTVTTELRSFGKQQQ